MEARSPMAVLMMKTCIERNAVELNMFLFQVFVASQTWKRGRYKQLYYIRNYIIIKMWSKISCGTCIKQKTIWKVIDSSNHTEHPSYLLLNLGSSFIFRCTTTRPLLNAVLLVTNAVKQIK